MPKGRYRIMTQYMPKVGNLGLDMMYRTCTVQTNLDFSSEADMVKKLRVSLALQPVATALFANSPFTEGKPNGFLSFRSEIWRDTDPDRSGMLPWAFEDGMGFERWVDYALDVPMYFVKRGDDYIDVSGLSFRDLFAGKLKQLPGERATISDWANHISTIFPEVRLKRYLEMRGADGGPWRRLPALAGLLGRHPLRRCVARCGLGPRQGLDRGGTPEAARRRADAGLRRDHPQSQHALACGRDAEARARRAGPSRAASMPAARTKPNISNRSRISSRAARRRRRNCSRSITGRGAARSNRCSRVCVLTDGQSHTRDHRA